MAELRANEGATEEIGSGRKTMDSNSTTQPRRASHEPGPFRPLRIWIPLLFLASMPALHQVPMMVDDGPPWLWMARALGPLLCSALILLWWLFASRATWKERIAGVLGLVVAFAATALLSDESMRGPVVMSVTIPMGFAAFALAAVLGSRVLSFRRTGIAVLVGALGFAPTTLARSAGATGDFGFDLHRRWVTSSEDLMLAEERAATSTANAEDVVGAPFDLSAPAWPGFRGRLRDGRDTHDLALRLSRDWNASPPELLWSLRVGPGWSSFAVAGDHVFTQEQRGESEATLCLRAETGERIWMRETQARFDDPLGGPGPRATPTLALGSVFVLGGRGQSGAPGRDDR